VVTTVRVEESQNERIRGEDPTIQGPWNLEVSILGLAAQGPTPSRPSSGTG
jgi:hypothetical protein